MQPLAATRSHSSGCEWLQVAQIKMMHFCTLSVDECLLSEVPTNHFLGCELLADWIPAAAAAAAAAAARRRRRRCHRRRPRHQSGGVEGRRDASFARCPFPRLCLAALSLCSPLLGSEIDIERRLFLLPCLLYPSAVHLRIAIAFAVAGLENEACLRVCESPWRPAEDAAGLTRAGKTACRICRLSWKKSAFFA